MNSRLTSQDVTQGASANAFDSPSAHIHTLSAHAFGLSNASRAPFAGHIPVPAYCLNHTCHPLTHVRASCRASAHVRRSLALFNHLLVCCLSRAPPPTAYLRSRACLPIAYRLPNICCQRLYARHLFPLPVPLPLAQAVPPACLLPLARACFTVPAFLTACLTWLLPSTLARPCRQCSHARLHIHLAKLTSAPNCPHRTPLRAPSPVASAHAPATHACAPHPMPSIGAPTTAPTPGTRATTIPMGALNFLCHPSQNNLGIIFFFCFEIF